MYAKDGKKENLWQPLLAFAVLALLTLLFYAQYQSMVSEMMYDALFEQYGDADFVAYMRAANGIMPAAATSAIGAVTLFVSPIVGAVITALIGYVILRAIFKAGGAATFRGLFAVALYAGVITALGAFAAIAVSVWLGNVKDMFSFAALMDTEGASAVVKTLAGISLFSIARAVALGFGINGLLTRGDEPMAKDKAATAAIVTVCVLFFGGLVVAAITSLASGGGTGAYDLAYKAYLNTR